MLRLAIHFDPTRERAVPWSDQEDGWIRGRSKIEPYRHRRLESFAIQDLSRFAVIVRERTDQANLSTLTRVRQVSDVEFDRLVAEASDWPLNVVCVVVDDHARTVAIYSGEWGSAPLYAVANREELFADWDVARLYPHLENGLEPGRTIFSMAQIGYPYSRRTIFRDMALLTERSRATWDAETGRLDIAYPRPRPRLMPRPIQEGADVVGGFEQVMRYAVSLWADEGSVLATQLSGGIDSSAVAAALGAYDDRRVRSYGLIMPGTNGAFQEERRNELIDRFGLIDYAIPGDRYLPLALDSRRNEDGTMIPWSEFYYDAIGALGRQAIADGVDTLFTGLGGDEISTLMRGEELPSSSDSSYEPNGPPPFLTDDGLDAYRTAARNLDPAPMPAVEQSCIEAAATNADGFLRNGLWPAYPYCTPELVNFCRSLPAAWRQNRDIQRLYLRRLGCSDVVAYPKVIETFSEVMTLAMKQNRDVLIPLYTESRLANDGWVDRAKLLDTYDRFQRGEADRWKDSLLELAVLELTIRALERARPMSYAR